MQVFNVLDDIFNDCPWPVPPSAILLHLPFMEKTEKENEAKLRALISTDKSQLHCTDWKFANIRFPHNSPRVYYGSRPGVTRIKEIDWAKFLSQWTHEMLDAASRLLLLSSPKDLETDTAKALAFLRENHQLLLLQRDDKMSVYQQTLARLHDLGMLNLSLVLVGPQGRPLCQERKTIRSLTAKLRESRKREKQIRRCMIMHSREKLSEVAAHERTKLKLLATQKELVKAKQALNEFKKEHPEWEPPEDVDLARTQSRAFQQLFYQLDADLNVKAQMKHDPSGCLSAFWSEQRRRLHVNKRCAWNPQVGLCAY